MKTRILSMHDVQLIARHVGLDALMDEMIQRLGMAIRLYNPAKTTIPTRSGFAYSNPEIGLVEWMPIMEAGRQVTIKVVGYHPNNPHQRGLPTILSTVSTYDTCSGHLVGVADGTFITALRTGAASAVASQLMASGDSHTVGIIGCGSQAVTQLHALARLFDIQQVLALDVNPKVTESFVKRAAFMGLEITPVREDMRQALVEEADILCTCTSIDIGAGPVFAETQLKPEAHINAVGSDFPGKIEIPRAILTQSFVCPDFREQAVVEGECQQLDPEEIGPSLWELAQNPGAYAQARQGWSVFDSTGWALEDQVALQMLMEYADDLNVGSLLELESISGDPHNPYHFYTSRMGE